MAETLNAFAGRAEEPTGEDLRRVLGSAKPAWDRLLAQMTDRYGASGEWKCYSVKAGWSLRVATGKRTVLWVSPGKDSFQVAVILGPKAAAAVPPALRALVDGAPKYPEGTAVRIQVRRIRDLSPIEELAAVKMSVT